MTHVALLKEASRLSVKERLELLEELWDGLSKEMDGAPLLPWQEALLDSRMAGAERDPKSESSYEQVMERVRKKITDCSQT